MGIFAFGPGTQCLCATCSSLPAKCTWAGGAPYAGTLLLYSQEIAMNHLWSQEEYDKMTTHIVDHGTTQGSVCETQLLHVFHNADRFSKFSFISGKYKELDMRELNITQVRDFSTYIALRSAGQGIGRQELETRLSIGGDGSLADLCKNDLKS